MEGVARQPCAAKAAVGAGTRSQLAGSSPGPLQTTMSGTATDAASSRARRSTIASGDSTRDEPQQGGVTRRCSSCTYTHAVSADECGGSNPTLAIAQSQASASPGSGQMLRQGSRARSSPAAALSPWTTSGSRLARFRSARALRRSAAGSMPVALMTFISMPVLVAVAAAFGFQIQYPPVEMTPYGQPSRLPTWL